MGWSSWNYYRDTIDDAHVRLNAQALASSGLKDDGYVYVNVDGGWQGIRDTKGVLQPNSKFPNMPALTAFVHGLGLKIGIYTSPGPLTCNGYVGSYQHEAQDAKTFASWGFDYLKYDWCTADKVYTPAQEPAVYKLMSDALRATGRPFVFSISQHGLYNVWQWAASSGANLWRTTRDLHDNWTSMSSIGFDQQIGLAPYAGAGHWNDPDMLQVGNGGMTTIEDRTHFSLWAILAAPLIAGNDLTNMHPWTLDILHNREVIAVDQDPLAHEGQRIVQHGTSEVWTKPLQAGAFAVGLFNRGDTTATIAVTWSQVGFKGTPMVHDLWTHQDVGLIPTGYSTQVPPHGVVMLRIHN